MQDSKETKEHSQFIAEFPTLNIVVGRTSTGRVQIVKHFPECHPNVCVLGPASLNSKYHKLVHSAVIKKIKPFFMEDPSMYGFNSGYDNLPEDLLQELLSHLKNKDATYKQI